MKVSLELLKEKIICEYTELCDSISYSIENEELKPETLLLHSEYLFIKFRIYIFFSDFYFYMENLDERLIEFLLMCENASDYLAYIYENGFAGDCDLKSVEGIEKLMIFAYNNTQYQSGKFDFLPIEFSL
ncbi:MAG: hypothetical protein E7510_14765 [Ruminococcus sp.]|nr:hypothetical protein [Ruminococcus sp.]MBR6599577.1 hypothetical protein [Oscillospiraceae bacterium]